MHVTYCELPSDTSTMIWKANGELIKILQDPILWTSYINFYINLCFCGKEIQRKKVHENLKIRIWWICYLIWRMSWFVGLKSGLETLKKYTPLFFFLDLTIFLMHGLFFDTYFKVLQEGVKQHVLFFFHKGIAKKCFERSRMVRYELPEDMLSKRQKPQEKTTG